MSTPLPSATPRSGLTVPATQNTAPVIKYRCLFTHDMRRKAKRWQDGFLRYHTFNKRVMVYDNTGYFIGDLHWRAPEGIQEGDELELDKGVLIQICEPLGQTETDISSLYKNKSQSPARNETPPSSVRSVARPSLSQNSRSLKDLLGVNSGVNKTPRPQPLSPFEQRQRQMQTQTQTQRQAPIQQLQERPAKRQRAASPEQRQQHVVDLSDSPPRAQQARTEQRPAPRPQPQPNATIPQARASPRDTVAEQPEVPPSAQPAPQTRPSSGAELSNTLRLSNDKPRRKLMYLQSQSSLRTSQPKSQLSRTHCQPPPSNDPSSSPVIIIDDDDEPGPPNQPQPQPILRPIPIPSSLPIPDSQPLQFKTTSSSEATVTNPRRHAQLFPKSSSTPVSTLYAIPAHQPTPPPPPPEPTPKPPENITRARTTGLRKSLSDPTTITSLHPRGITAPSLLNPIPEGIGTGNGNDEQGPWTSEALDLFDFWPPGRPKPA
ncbi:hypothetical protein BJY04DRAFT_215528 [Aspergillus karnatakaensis]|uniref:DNA helicase ZGRF1-like domain-containing protein n=1 Tax=Aspergillus karnatakaensis TaxID=1810916 RepID=UPI003CCD7CF7